MYDDTIEFLTVKEFAARMSVTDEQVYSWIKNKKVASLRLTDKPNSPWRIPKTELFRFREISYEGKHI